mmetsp:Transcript_113120/g.325188  ORF Transcript_113120/g.325188 Transcript_113120/m.325188 type:complete len:275 (-) Transcript_113120:1576-2400(-)
MAAGARRHARAARKVQSRARMAVVDAGKRASDAAPQVGRLEGVVLHVGEQRGAGTVLEAKHLLGPLEILSRRRPLAFRIILVAHVEVLEKGHSVVLPHRDHFLGVMEEVRARELLLLPDFKELARPEALANVPRHGWRGLHLQVFEVEVEGVQLEGDLRAPHHGLVDDPGLARHRWSARGDDRVGCDEVHAVGVSCPLEVFGDAHIRGEVGGVDLEIAADSALDRPPTVDPEAQVDVALRTQALLQARVRAVPCECRRFVDLPQNPRERHDRHV